MRVHEHVMHVEDEGLGGVDVLSAQVLRGGPRVVDATHEQKIWLSYKAASLVPSASPLDARLTLISLYVSYR